MNVCFVILEGTRLFDPSSPKTYGGAEWRASTFARGLAARGGHDVTVVLGARDPRPPARFGDVRAVFDPSFDQQKKHFPWIRWDRFRGSLLWEIPGACVRHFRERAAGDRPYGWPRYRGLDADVTCVFGVNDIAARIIASRREAGARTLLFLASDMDLDDRFRPGGERGGAYGESGHLGHYAIQHADGIVVQSEVQRARLEEQFGRVGVIIRNPIDIAALDRSALPAEARSGVLWVGRADSVHKRPEAGFDVAARCTELSFHFVMNREKRREFEEIAAKAPANVEIVERVGPDAIAHVFARSSAFLNTSVFEGFPNTFLQAAVHRVPYLSLDVDPDGVFAREAVGFCADGDPVRLAASLRAAVARDGDWPARIDRAAEYVRNHHDLEGRVSELDALLRTLE